MEEILFKIETILHKSKTSKLKVAGFVVDENTNEISFFGDSTFVPNLKASLTSFQEKPKLELFEIWA